jgi:hypothetical protein
MKIILFLFALTFSLSTHAQTADKAQQQKLTGVWINNDEGKVTLIMNTDGTGQLDDEAITFKTIGNKLHLTTAEERLTYTYEIQNDVLIVRDGDLESPMKFLRKGSKAETPDGKIETRKRQ